MLLTAHMRMTPIERRRLDAMDASRVRFPPPSGAFSAQFGQGTLHRTRLLSPFPFEHNSPVRAQLSLPSENETVSPCGSRDDLFCERFGYWCMRGEPFKDGFEPITSDPTSARMVLPAEDHSLVSGDSRRDRCRPPLPSILVSPFSSRPDAFPCHCTSIAVVLVRVVRSPRGPVPSTGRQGVGASRALAPANPARTPATTQAAADDRRGRWAV